MRLSKTSGIVLAGIASLLMVGCNPDVAGNSAETGSPELAGVLYLDNGAPASYARVRVVCSGFDYYRGDDLDDVIEVQADSNGSYAVDSLPGFKSFSLEAFHEESGKRLLRPNLALDGDSLEVSDSLFAPGTALLNVENVVGENVDDLEGEATIVGTTFLQPVKVEGGVITIDSLPVGDQDVVIHLFGKDTLDAVFNGLIVTAGDTIIDTIPEAIIRTYKAPLALPKGQSLDEDVVLTDFPLALRMDSSVFEFDSIITNEKRGRFEAFRINAKGERSATLPISIGRWDAESKEAQFWIRLDSLNFDDSLIVEFNSLKASVFAKDVFPTNGYYRTVWHFDGGTKVLTDVAENKQVSVGTPSNVKEVDGAVGKAYYFDGSASVTIDSSVTGELNFPADTLSFSVWVKINSVKDSSMIFSKDGQYSLVVDPKEGFIAGFRETHIDSTGDTLQSAHTFRSGDSLLVANKWTHIYFQNRGTTQSFYIDGVKIPQAKKTTTAQFHRYESAKLILGRSFKGAMDELVFSDGLRYDSWVKALYLNQNPDEIWPKF